MCCTALPKPVTEGESWNIFIQITTSHLLFSICWDKQLPCYYLWFATPVRAQLKSLHWVWAGLIWEMLELRAQWMWRGAEEEREAGTCCVPFTAGELRPGNGTICCQFKREVTAGSRQPLSSSPFEAETPFLTSSFDDKWNTQPEKWLV